MAKMGDRSSSRNCNPCMDASLPEGVQMVAAMQLIFAFAYLIHGAHLSSLEGKYDFILGIMYIISGVLYLGLAGLLWKAVKQSPKPKSHLHLWMASSVVAQMIVVITTLSRNGLEEEVIWSANIWIFCGLFIQSYMIWIVYAFVKEADKDDSKPVIEDPDPDTTVPPPAESSLPPPVGNNTNTDPEGDTAIIESADNENHENDTVIIESADNEKVLKVNVNVTDDMDNAGTEAKTETSTAAAVMGESEKGGDADIAVADADAQGGQPTLV